MYVLAEIELVNMNPTFLDDLQLGAKTMKCNAWGYMSSRIPTTTGFLRWEFHLNKEPIYRDCTLNILNIVTELYSGNVIIVGIHRIGVGYFKFKGKLLSTIFDENKRYMDGL